MWFTCFILRLESHVCLHDIKICLSTIDLLTECTVIVRKNVFYLLIMGWYVTLYGRFISAKCNQSMLITCNHPNRKVGISCYTLFVSFHIATSSEHKSYSLTAPDNHANECRKKLSDHLRALVYVKQGKTISSSGVTVATLA